MLIIAPARILGPTRIPATQKLSSFALRRSFHMFAVFDNLLSLVTMMTMNIRVTNIEIEMASQRPSMVAAIKERKIAKPGHQCHHLDVLD